MVQKAIENIQVQYGPVLECIYIHPHFKYSGAAFHQHFAQERQLVKTAFLLAKHVQAPLNELGQKYRAAFLCTSQIDGAGGTAKIKGTSIFGGGLPGLVKCLNLEWSPVVCKYLDQSPSYESEQMAENILTELHNPDRSTVEVLHQENKRYTLSARPAAHDYTEIQTRINNEDVFLVSGGARGVTATCVIEMSKAFKCKFILMGRSDGKFQIPSYARNIDEEGALKKAIMEEMKNSGKKPNLQEVKKQFKNIQAKKEIQLTLTP